jgi:ketosteroid isomerase-like protein
MNATQVEQDAAHPAVELIRQCFDAYSRGDIPFFVAAVADECSWSGSMAPDVPYAGRFTGSAGAAKFFEAIGTHLEVKVFDVNHYVSEGEWVVAMGSWAGVVRKTGRSYDSRVALTFQVRNGRIIRFVGYEDTGLMAAAVRG